MIALLHFPCFRKVFLKQENFRVSGKLSTWAGLWEREGDGGTGYACFVHAGRSLDRTSLVGCAARWPHPSGPHVALPELNREGLRMLRNPCAHDGSATCGRRKAGSRRGGSIRAAAQTSHSRKVHTWGRASHHAPVLPARLPRLPARLHLKARLPRKAHGPSNFSCAS